MIVKIKAIIYKIHKNLILTYKKMNNLMIIY